MGGEKKSSSFHPETALLVRAALGLPTLGWVPGFTVVGSRNLQIAGGADGDRTHDLMNAIQTRLAVT